MRNKNWLESSNSEKLVINRKITNFLKFFFVIFPQIIHFDNVIFFGLQVWISILARFSTGSQITNRKCVTKLRNRSWIILMSTICVSSTNRRFVFFDSLRIFSPKSGFILDLTVSDSRTHRFDKRRIIFEVASSKLLKIPPESIFNIFKVSLSTALFPSSGHPHLPPKPDQSFSWLKA